MRPLSKARERWREDPVPSVHQEVGDTAPTPAAMPRAMDQNERFLLGHCSLSKGRRSTLAHAAKVSSATVTQCLFSAVAFCDQSSRPSIAIASTLMSTP